MSIRILTNKSTKEYSEKILKVKTALDECDAVLIGAGAGLSSSAGFSYGGDRFEKYFLDFKKKYGFRDMYEGGFYPYETLEEHWAYWSRYVYINRYMDPPGNLYQKLLSLIKDKDYFVLTTNVDHCFQKAGFDKKRLFYTQGDYGLVQCSGPCCMETHDNEDIIRQMVISQGLSINDRGDLVFSSDAKMKISPDLVPYCHKCGRPMSMNLRADETFVEDEGWGRASARYSDFIRRHQGLKVCMLELGVGMNTPGIIKYPFWNMTAGNAKSFMVSINYGQAYVPKEIAHRSVCINEDISRVVENLASAGK